MASRKFSTTMMSMTSLPLVPPYTLYPHQERAMVFMKQIESKSPWSNGMCGGLLFMTMGLGKSLISVAHSWLHHQEMLAAGKPVFPTLILTSKLLMQEWKVECFETLFDTSIKVLYLHQDYTDSQLINALTRKKVMTYDFVVTTYDVLTSAYKLADVARDIQVKKNKRLEYLRKRTRVQCDLPTRTGPAILYTTPWCRVIADESQIFANPKTSVFDHVMGLYGDYIWCLTGTPIRNHVLDLWSQLRFCGYDRVTQPQKWTLLYEELIKTGCLLDHIHEVPYEQTHIELPPLSDCYTSVTMDPQQRACYLELKQAWNDGEKHGIQITSKSEEEDIPEDRPLGTPSVSSLYTVALFSKMRQCTIAPYLLHTCFQPTPATQTDQVLSQVLAPWKSWICDRRGTAGFESPKMVELRKCIANVPPGEKVLIFSIFTKALHLVSQMLETYCPDTQVGMIHGGIPLASRQESIQAMKDGELDILLLSYKVGSRGLNLTRASHVICLEEWWTPDVPAQAIARCHRAGQTRPVYAYHLVTKDSIEERCVAICQKKRSLQEHITKTTPFTITRKMMKAILA